MEKRINSIPFVIIYIWNTKGGRVIIDETIRMILLYRLFIKTFTEQKLDDMNGFAIVNKLFEHTFEDSNQS